MSEYIKDEENEELYYCVAKDIKYLKEDILIIIYKYFKNLRRTAIYFEEVYEHLQKTLSIDRINRSKLKSLLNMDSSQSIVKINNVIESYNKYGKGEKIDLVESEFLNKLFSLKVKKEKIFSDNIKQSTKIEYYYCSKKIFFPLKDVLKKIYDFYQAKGVELLGFDDIYEYLRESFMVKSFNRQNLYNLLGISNFIPLSLIRKLMIQTKANEYVDDENNYEIIDDFLIANSVQLYNIINVLGADFIIALLENGLSFILKNFNPLRLFFDPNAKCIQLKDNSKGFLFSKKDSQLLIEIIKDLWNDEENLKILLNKQDLLLYISNFIDKKILDKKHRDFKVSIFELLKNVNEDNSQARVRYLMPTEIANILESQEIYVVKDLNSLKDDTIVKLFEYKKDFLYSVIKLSQSLPSYIKDKFDDYIKWISEKKTNSFSENYLSILEKNSDGFNFEKIGRAFGISREGIRQIIRKQLQKFKEFIFSKEDNIYCLIRSLVEDNLFVQNKDIFKLFGENAKIFKFMLKSITSNCEFRYIRELDKFYFADEYSWSMGGLQEDCVLKRKGFDLSKIDSFVAKANISNCHTWYEELLSLVGTMPEQIEYKGIEVYIQKAMGRLSFNGINLDISDCKKILLKDYKKIGNLFTKTNINIGKKFEILINKFFPDEINVYNDDFLDAFRSKYYEFYGEKLEQSDHAIQARILSFCMLVDKGKYKLNAYIRFPEEFVIKLHNFIKKENIVFMNNIYYEFEEDFNRLGIKNRYYMQSLLKLQLPEFYYTKDYVSVSKKDSSIYDEIILYIKDSGRVVDIDELRKQFSWVPDLVLFNAVNDKQIVNLHRRYIYFKNIEYDQLIIKKVESILESLVSSGQIRNSNELYLKLMFACPEFLEKYCLDGQFDLFSMVSSIFGYKFTFKRPFFARNDVVIKGRYERLREFVNEHERLMIGDILEFARDNKLPIDNILDFIDGLENFIFKNAYEIEKIDNEIVDKELIDKIDKILSAACINDDYISSKNFGGYYLIGENIDWNCWILYSIIKKFSKKFNVITQSKLFKNKDKIIAYPIFIKKSLSINSYDEFILYLKEKTNLSASDFENYIEVKGIN